MKDELKATAVIAGGVSLGLLAESGARILILAGLRRWYAWRERRAEPARRAEWEAERDAERERYVDAFMDWPPEHPVRVLFDEAMEDDTTEAYKVLGHAMFVEFMRPPGVPAELVDLMVPEDLTEQTAREFVQHVQRRQSEIATALVRDVGHEG